MVDKVPQEQQTALKISNGFNAFDMSHAVWEQGVGQGFSFDLYGADRYTQDVDTALWIVEAKKLGFGATRWGRVEDGTLIDLQSEPDGIGLIHEIIYGAHDSPGLAEKKDMILVGHDKPIHAE